MRSTAALGVTTIAVLLAGACARPTAAPHWAPAPAPAPAAVALVPPPAPATSFFGARQGAEYVVLAYDTGADALRRFGPPLPLATPPPNYQVPRFLYVLSGRPDRVFAILDTFQGYRAFGGDGTRWHAYAPLGAAGLGPHISDDGALIMLDVFDQVDGEFKAMTRVMTWDGQIIDQWPYQERETYGFVEHGQRWITQARDDQRKLVHTAGAEPRAYADETWFDRTAGGTSRDRYRVKDGVATVRGTGEVVATFLAPTLKDTDDSFTHVAAAAPGGERGLAVMRTTYFKGWCTDIPCPVGFALYLWRFGAGGPEDERLFLSTAQPIDPASGQVTIAASGAHVLWFVDHHTAAVYDLVAASRRTIPTDYELLMIQSPRS
jgi:hypothetical protein